MYENLTFSMEPLSRHRYQLQSIRLRALLGIPGKLKPDTELVQTVGDTIVVVYSHEHAKLISPKATRPHRIFAVCKNCGRQIPAGRLDQHRKACANAIAGKYNEAVAQ